MPNNLEKLTLERLREVMSYDPETGAFMWRFRTGPTCKLDQPAGRINAHGYRRITIDGINHAAHQLAWFYHYGVRPPLTVDHKNRQRADNRIDNLRLATRSEQCRNRLGTNLSTTGLKGVSRFNKQYQRAKFRSTITVDGKRIFLGLFMTAEDAHAAYCRAAKLHGEFALTNETGSQTMTSENFKLYHDLDCQLRRETDETKRMQIALRMSMERDGSNPAFKSRQDALMGRKPRIRVQAVMGMTQRYDRNEHEIAAEVLKRRAASRTKQPA